MVDPTPEEIEAAARALCRLRPHDGEMAWRDWIPEATAALTAAAAIRSEPDLKLRLPPIPDDDNDFSPAIAREIIGKYQHVITEAARLIDGLRKRAETAENEIVLQRAAADGAASLLLDVQKDCIAAAIRGEPAEEVPTNLRFSPMPDMSIIRGFAVLTHIPAAQREVFVKLANAVDDLRAAAAIRSKPAESVMPSGDDVDELIDRVSLGGPNEAIAREALHRIRLEIERALFGEPNRTFPSPSTAAPPPPAQDEKP